MIKKREDLTAPKGWLNGAERERNGEDKNGGKREGRKREAERKRFPPPCVSLIAELDSKC